MVLCRWVRLWCHNIGDGRSSIWKATHFGKVWINLCCLAQFLCENQIFSSRGLFKKNLLLRTGLEVKYIPDFVLPEYDVVTGNYYRRSILQRQIPECWLLYFWERSLNFASSLNLKTSNNIWITASIIWRFSSAVRQSDEAGLQVVVARLIKANGRQRSTYPGMERSHYR